MSRTTMSRKRLAALGLASLVGWLASGWAWAAWPEAVSPGSLRGVAPIAHRCPTFSWAGVEGSRAYELVVYAVPAGGEAADAAMADAPPVLRKILPGSAGSWTPALADCLTPGSGYAWSVRPLEEGGAGDWSETMLFTVRQAPSAVEVEAALAVLESYLSAATTGSAAAQASETAAPTSPEPPATPAPDRRQGAAPTAGVSLPAGTTAFTAELADTTGQTYGVLGRVHSPGGAAVAAENTAGGPDLVLAGDLTSAATVLTESALDRPSVDPQVFEFRNSGAGSLDLEIDGVRVVTTLTDQDTLAGLSCDASQLPQWSGTAWACGNDYDTDTLAGLSCTSGQLAKWSSTAWTCGDDLDTDTLAGLSCADGQLPKWSSAAWTCAPDNHFGQTWSGTALTGLAVQNALGAGLLGQVASPTGWGVIGWATATSGTSNYGVYGQSDSSDGSGVYGLAHATSGTNYGVFGMSDSTAGHGVYGHASTTTGTNYGVRGKSNSTAGRGVVGHAAAGSGTTYGVRGITDSPDGYGVDGRASTTTGTNYGVYGRSSSVDGYGVYGYAASTDYDDVGFTYGPDGVYGRSDGSLGRGVVGYAASSDWMSSGIGVYGKSDSSSGYGVAGYANAAGVYGESSSGLNSGVQGQSTSGQGVYGLSTSGPGVRGDSSSGDGVHGWSETGNAVYGLSYNGNAGYFSGAVTVTGTLSKGGGSFKIDHPLDSAGKYLHHSFVESPDMMNIYNGNAVLDEAGEAWVELPEWFEALNRDFRYQLTSIGANVAVWVTEEIAGNRFQIAGSAPGAKVSWQVTGIRHDAWAEAHRIPVEEVKPAGEAGTYLHPVELGLPEELGRDYERSARRRERHRARPEAKEPDAN